MGDEQGGSYHPQALLRFDAVDVNRVDATTNGGITRLRGQWGSYTDETSNPPMQVPIMPTFHPAYLLRNYTVDTRKKVWSDMQAVLSRLVGCSPD
jgi:DNA polymerase